MPEILKDLPNGLRVTTVTETGDRVHRPCVHAFGQWSPKVENFIMLCSNLPPRIYESLKTLCCLAKGSGPLQAHEIAFAAHLPPAQTAKILQLMTCGLDLSNPAVEPKVVFGWPPRRTAFGSPM